MFLGKKKNKKEGEFYGNLRENGLTITDYFTDGLLIFDKNNKVVLINPWAEEFFGVEKEKILGKSILDLNRFPKFEPLVFLLGGGVKEVSREELQISENLILEVTTVPIITGGIKLSTLVILHDVSRERLVQKMKTEFVTVAAHQLRTPTSAVKWSLEVLLEGDLGKLNKEQKKLIEKAHKTNDKAIRLVNDLLNVAEIEEGRYLSKLVLLNIEDLIQSIIEEYKEQIKEKKIKFEFKKPEEQLPKTMVDVEKTKIAVRNILDNALRYTLPKGKISIFVKKEEKNIEVQIQDSGLGIPLNEQDKIFTKFFRGSNIMRIDTEGTGLGLYIAKNIIEAHRGIIWFESEEGKGTTFYFTLPIKEKFGEYLTEKFY
ncbi:MAG: hypothetical protein COU42_00350 [Candidatus Nealsonbacteria bacterium CG10_big_fil_rev_8_21_14_0_10_36_24]|uniref:histidine kinase n=2 Tax=Candidatus Nealsoniibacteriota TaxID=1817911 RepID=A0A2H0YNV5_9BACT|nr:MAG: hypothetical protein COU42_00350 [Candidatus Nealsonbacteria bacterium CG10_big_fil_rev_8_21_14_0_10_36_24]PIS40184.1 MAG: hypothetical protein COT32_01160 [Candidatus Nealsonbacteria bacterium CG08_land_8_20_14_0_20_36_22]